MNFQAADAVGLYPTGRSAANALRGVWSAVSLGPMTQHTANSVIQPARAATGVDGLDEILNGGLPKHRLYLIKGDPGVGKTTLGMQFLMRGQSVGEESLYITLSETREELDTVARSHGWDITAIHIFELAAIENQLGKQTDTTFFHASDIELNRTTQALLEEVERVKPGRVVFDSLSEMRMLSETPLRFRRQILQLKQFFAGRKITVLFLDDRTGGRDELQIESVVHGVIELDRVLPDYGIVRRQLHVQKIRGSRFREGRHDLTLRTGGMVVFPRLVAGEHHQPFERGHLASGVAALDALLGGGIDRGTSNMFMGPPGCGKSTLAMRFAATAAERGEKVAVYIFDETQGTFLERSRQLELNLQQHVENGLVRVQQIDPAELSPGEFTYQIQHAVGTWGARMVIIDSINGYLNAMPGERYLALQLHELLAYLNQQGVVTIMVLAQQGLIGAMRAGVDLTYLADTVLLMRYYEMRGAMKQAISVIKKRTGTHERTLRDVRIATGGIEVGEVLTSLHGILLGTPQVVTDNHEDASRT